MQVLIQGLYYRIGTSDDPYLEHNDCMMNSDEFFMAYKHDKWDNIFWLDFLDRIPLYKMMYPLKRNSSWICSNRLDDRPDQKYEY